MQIANSTVYKSNIRNYTSNPTRRDDFTVNISYNASLSKAQNAIRKVLEEHEAVLKNPEPLVLVDQFMKDLINLRVYYWIDAKKYSWLKVRSSIMRLVKKVFQTEGIELPMPLGKPISLSPEPAHPHSLSDSPLTNQDEEIKDSSLSSPKSGTNLLSNRTQDEG